MVSGDSQHLRHAAWHHLMIHSTSEPVRDLYVSYWMRCRGSIRGAATKRKLHAICRYLIPGSPLQQKLFLRTRTHHGCDTPHIHQAVCRSGTCSGRRHGCARQGNPFQGRVCEPGAAVRTDAPSCAEPAVQSRCRAARRPGARAAAALLELAASGAAGGTALQVRVQARAPAVGRLRRTAAVTPRSLPRGE